MNIRKAIKLDIISIKPYLTIKNLILLVAFGGFYALVLKNPIMTLGMAQIFSMLFATYPFAVGENYGGIDPLLKVMGLKPGDVVIGRYIMALMSIVIMLIAGIAMAVLGSVLYPVENLTVQILASASTMFVLTSLIIFIQYPPFFKLGYLKSKKFRMVPSFLVGIVIFIATSFSSKIEGIVEYLIQYRHIVLLALVLFWALAFSASVALSKKFYKARDF